MQLCIAETACAQTISGLNAGDIPCSRIINSCVLPVQYFQYSQYFGRQQHCSFTPPNSGSISAVSITDIAPSACVLNTTHRCAVPCGGRVPLGVVVCRPGPSVRSTVRVKSASEHVVTDHPPAIYVHNLRDLHEGLILNKPRHLQKT